MSSEVPVLIKILCRDCKLDSALPNPALFSFIITLMNYSALKDLVWMGIGNWQCYVLHACPYK